MSSKLPAGTYRKGKTHDRDKKNGLDSTKEAVESRKRSVHVSGKIDDMGRKIVTMQSQRCNNMETRHHNQKHGNVG